MHTDEHLIPTFHFRFRARRGDGPPRPRVARPSGDLFYVNLLGGREVFPTEAREAHGSRWFIVGDTLIEQRADPLTVDTPIQLEVHAPEELLQQAWDAGYRVEVADAEMPVRLSVFDPRGRRIDLIAVRRSLGP